MWGGMEGWGWWGWGMGIVHGLLWWAILILGVVVLVRMLGRGSDSTPRRRSMPSSRRSSATS